MRDVTTMWNAKAIGVFLAVTYGFSWALAFVFFGRGGELGSTGFLAMATAFMFGPAIGSCVTQRWVLGRPLADLGWVSRPNRHWISAWILPLLLGVVALLVSGWCVPGVDFDPSTEALYRTLEGQLPPETVEAARSQVQGSWLAGPGTLFFVSLFQVLLAGLTVNAVAAYGEELGWRGFLWNQLRGLGFWRSSAVTGVVWGVWHLPLVAHGYNYPGHPVGAVVMMTVLCVALSPMLSYVRMRGGSVLPAAIFHGTFNAAATLAIFLPGASPWTAGMTGVAGLVVFAVADLGIYSSLRGSRGHGAP